MLEDTYDAALTAWRSSFRMTWAAIAALALLVLAIAGGWWLGG